MTGELSTRVQQPIPSRPSATDKRDHPVRRRAALREHPDSAYNVKGDDIAFRRTVKYLESQHRSYVPTSNRLRGVILAHALSDRNRLIQSSADYVYDAEIRRAIVLHGRMPLQLLHMC